MHREGSCSKADGVLSKVQMLNLVLGVGVFSLLPTLGSLTALLFPALFNKVQNKGTQKGCERGMMRNFLHTFPSSSTPVVLSHWAWFSYSCVYSLCLGCETKPPCLANYSPLLSQFEPILAKFLAGFSRFLKASFSRCLSQFFFAKEMPEFFDKIKAGEFTLNFSRIQGPAHQLFFQRTPTRKQFLISLYPDNPYPLN